MLFNLFGPRILWQGDGGGSADPPKVDPPKADPPATPPPATPPASDPPGPVPYDRFKEVNDALKTANDRLAKLEADQRAAADKDAEAQGKWEELAKQREVELKTEKLARIRLEVAAKKGIPADLAGRLTGETAEDMEKDADTLLQFLKPATGPGVPPAGKGQGAKPLDFSTMTPEEIRKASKGKAVTDLV